MLVVKLLHLCSAHGLFCVTGQRPERVGFLRLDIISINLKAAQLTLFDYSLEQGNKPRHPPSLSREGRLLRLSSVAAEMHVCEKSVVELHVSSMQFVGGFSRFSRWISFGREVGQWELSWKSPEAQ